MFQRRACARTPYSTDSRRKASAIQLATDLLAKRIDQRLARQQFEFDKQQKTLHGWSSLISPTGVVLLGAALGLLGTAVGKFGDYLLNKRQLETSIILKASDVPQSLSPQQQEVQRARNLLWFSSANYIDLPKTFVSQLRAASQIPNGEALPSPVIVGLSQPLQDSTPKTTAPRTGIDFVLAFEPLMLTSYQDSRSLWTIGYGHVGPEVSKGMTITKDQASRLLEADLAQAYLSIAQWVTVPLNPSQRDALADFTFSVGAESLKNSTLLHVLNQGKYDQVPEQMMYWVHKDGIVSAGAVKRRKAEIELWNKGRGYH